MSDAPIPVTLTELLRGSARRRSTTEYGAAFAATRRLKLDTHDCRGTHPRQRRNPEITDPAERRQNNGYPNTRCRLSRLKRSNRAVNRGIGTLDRGKEKNDGNAYDGQNNEDNQFPSVSGQDHRSVTLGL